MYKKSSQRILFDGRSLIGQKTGVGYFTDGLLRALAEKDISITVFYFNFLGRYKTSNLPAHKNISYKEIRFFPPKLLGLLNRNGIELPLEMFLNTGNFSFCISPNFVSIPSMRRLPSVIAVHDMSPYDLPQFVKPKNLSYLKKLLPRSINRSDAIITISEFTKERIKHYFPYYEPRNILVVPIPFEPRTDYGDDVISNRIAKIVADGKYILHVGTIEPRKNLQGLVNGYAQLKDSIRKEYRLILLGGIGWMSEDLVKTIENLYPDSVILTGYVNDRERDYIYSNASLSCQLSLYEGFGMPVFEAGYYNLPLVLSDIPVFREVAGSYALYCDPTNPRDIAKTISSALSKKDWQTNKLASTSSWLRNAEEILSHINNNIPITKKKG